MSRVAPLVLVLALALAPPVAEGRPGGGENYTAPSPRPAPSGGGYSGGSRSSGGYSGSSRHGSGSSGGSAGGDMVGLALLLALVGGGFAVISIVGAVKRRLDAGTAQESEAAGPAVVHPDAGRVVERARAVFDGVYAAWNSGDADALRQWTSDGVYSRFSTLLAIQARAGYRNETIVTSPPRVALTALVPGPIWDRAELRFIVPCVDRDVASDGTLLREEASSFIEQWTFLRRHREGAGPAVAAPGACPACGALLPGGATPRCGSCGAVSNSGEHDWVLVEITQPNAPSRPEHRLHPSILARHPGLSVPVVEDRASAAFWAWIDAGLRGSRAPLAAFLAPDAKLQLLPTERAAVGSVTVVSLLPRGDGLQAEVDVEWSSAGDGRTTRMVLRTEASPRPPSLATLSCGACGGPLDRSDAPKCGWCGADRAPAPDEWAVIAIGR